MSSTPSSVPKYLAPYANLWKTDPRAANLEWFGNAHYGLFIHYGLYSQLGRHEWAMFSEAIPVAEYEKLYRSFDPRNFDADFITDLALEAGMKYVNFTSCHHEGFCLWDSKVEPFNSMQACGRDLVRELAAQCDKKGLGFFTYFTHVLNWRHPYALTRDLLFMARPDYKQPEPPYRLQRPEEFARYWEWSHGCLRELAKLDYPLAGIWLDIIWAYYVLPDLIPIKETYRLIRELCPAALVSFKQGATGEEDYASPEFRFHSQGQRLREDGRPAAAELADRAWEINRHKHNEICMTLQDDGWGYTASSPHKSADTLWGCLAYANAHNCNLLANVGPLPDGSIHPQDIASLRDVGRRLRAHGLPGPDEAINPDTRTKAGGA